MAFEKEILGVSIKLPSGERQIITVGYILDEIDDFEFKFIVDSLDVKFDNKINAFELVIIFENDTIYKKIIRPDMISIWQTNNEQQWTDFRNDNLELSEGIILEREVQLEKEKEQAKKENKESLIPK